MLTELDKSIDEDTDYFQAHCFYFLDSMTDQNSKLLKDIPQDFHLLRHLNRSGPFAIGILFMIVCMLSFT